MIIDENNPRLLRIRYETNPDASNNPTPVFNAYKRYLAAKRPFCVIFDARGAPALSKEDREQIARFFKLNETEFQRWCAGFGYVLTSVLERMVMRSIFFLINRPPFPYAIFATPEESTQWCEQQLASKK